MRLALYQGSGTLANIQQNLSTIERIARAAADQSVDLLIFPELFLSGYNLGNAVAQLAQPLNSPVLQQVTHIALAHQMAILIGYPERDRNRLYNAAILFDAEGHPVANYRKIHLFGEQEQQQFDAGTQWVMASIAGVKVGILICYDVEFPEAVRSLALQGAELIAIPTALMLPYTQIATQVVPVRALENQIFIAYVNRIGTEKELTYCGHSCVINPDGSDRVRAGTTETLLVSQIDLTALQHYRQAYCYLQERQPQLYKILGSSPPLYSP